MKPFYCSYFTLAKTLLVGTLSCCNLSYAEQTQNVILIIGDGMDSQQITMAKNYYNTPMLLMDSLPVRAMVQVQTSAEDKPKQVVYVADSANSATAIATGQITSRGRIATSAKTDLDLKTIAELAQESGYATGIVSTASVTDATPASFISHISLRGCENPSMMVDGEYFGGTKTNCPSDLIKNSGLGSISEQIAQGQTDIVLGGGLKHFGFTTEDQTSTVLALAEKNQYQVLQQKTQLEQLSSNGKVLGLFAPSTMEVQLQGTDGRKAEKPNPSLLNHIDWRIGSVEMPATMNCEKNPEYKDTPDLALMSRVAITHLQKRSSRGFFLMIESASIDKQSHARNPCGSIGEITQLNQALQQALDFAKTSPNTLILVTADHGQAAQIIPDESLFAPVGVPIYTPGHVARIVTQGKSTMAINYATNEFPVEEHTGTEVPLYGNSVAQGLVPASTTQVELFTIMKRYLSL